MSDILFHMVQGGPAPVAPYSHAVETDGWVFVTGQLATDLEDATRPLPEGIEAQTHKVMDNLRRVLEGVGLGFDRVVFARVFLTHFDRDYGAMNDIYKGYFKDGALPGRTTVGVTGLARGGLVEIDLVARRG
jgi:reactive intermediate/imine deaminase